MFKMADFCAGLGGASEAMVQSEKWEVMRIDNNPLLSGVPHSSQICILEFRDELRGMIEEGYQPERPTLVWCSPPCTEFSLGFSSPQSKAYRAGEDYQPDMTIVQACIDIIDMLQPKYWVIENVRGAIKWFKPILGKPDKIINGSIFLWGIFPSFDPGPIESKYAGDTWSSDPLRANKRALIPFQVSYALMKAIENQRTLWEWS